MKCAQFQKALPEVLESGPGAEEAEHLRSCPECSGLAEDLQTIAEQARLLAASDEPDARVWQRIRAAAELEGLVRPAADSPAAAADPPPAWVFPQAAWASPARLAAALVLLLALSATFLFRNINVKPGPAPLNVAERTAAASLIDANDQKILASVAEHAPEVRARYERNLKNVNAYIREAKQNVEANPDDEDARDSLRQAYEQKAMLYQMALSRSMQ